MLWNFIASRNINFSHTQFFTNDISYYVTLLHLHILLVFKCLFISCWYFLIASHWETVYRFVQTFNIFKIKFLLNVFRLLQFPCFEMSSICTPFYNAPVDAADLQLWVIYLLTSITTSAITYLTQPDIVSSWTVLNGFSYVMKNVVVS